MNNQHDIVNEKIVLQEDNKIVLEFVIPASGRGLGWWSLRALNEKGQERGYKGFRVEEYKRPTFEVTLDRPEGTVMFNRPLTVKGTARALSGFLLSGGKVSWSVTRTPRYFWHGSASLPHAATRKKSASGWP